MASFETKFFLGANSPSGFKSLYWNFVDPVKDRLRIIKSGPGSGKSTFMRIIAEMARENGESVELIQCSGDPDSLDGVYFPSKGVAYVDGTSPHVIEPTYSGSGDIYVDLSGFYDYEGIRGAHGEIMELTMAYKDWYSRAYKLIESAEKARGALLPPLPADAIASAKKRIKGIIMREVRPSGKEKGIVKRRFLSAISCKGHIALYDTVSELAERIYLFDNEAGLARLAMNDIYSAVISAGWDAVICLSPMDDSVIEHIILPEIALAFVSNSAKLPYPHPVYRHVRLDSIPDADYLRAVKQANKLPDTITGEAISALKKAKALHDELETKYNPYVDFDAVRALASEHAERLFG